jgi:KDO2-lipid IV(A) lauroyltransferase
MLKKFIQYIQYLLVAGFLKMFELLPIDFASSLGGFFGKYIGPLTHEAKIANINLKTIFPHLSRSERKEIIRQSMENVGRSTAEFPHLYKLKGGKFERRVKIKGLENLPKDKPFIPLTAHFGNWEVFTAFCNYYGLKASVVYKPPKNQWFDKILKDQRKKTGVDVIQQGTSGVREMVKRLKNKETIGLVVDQRIRDGELIDFLGRPGKTTTLPASLAFKFNYPLIPIRFRRTKGVHFEMEIMKPIRILKGDNEISVTKKINDVFSDWIREEPGQWLWANRRWRRLYDKLDKKNNIE